jgi:hypothetical protein
MVLPHWHDSPRIDMSPYSDTLSWFRINSYLLFLLNAVCLAVCCSPLYVLLCLFFLVAIALSVLRLAIVLSVLLLRNCLPFRSTWARLAQCFVFCVMIRKSCFVILSLCFLWAIAHRMEISFVLPTIRYLKVNTLARQIIIVFGSNKAKGLTRIAEIDYGH